MAVDCAQLWVGGQRCLCVARHVDFRNDEHMPLRRECDDAAHVILSVVTPIGLRCRGSRDNVPITRASTWSVYRMALSYALTTSSRLQLRSSAVAQSGRKRRNSAG